MTKGLQLPRDYAIAYGLKQGWKKWRASAEFKLRKKAKDQKVKDKKKRAMKRIKQAKKRLR